MRFYHLILTISIFLFSYTFSHGQRMVKEGNQWNVLFYSGFSPGSHTEIYKVAGDTIINDTTYAKILTTRDSSELNWSLYNTFLREDTTGKVFIRTQYIQDALLYDFDLKIGDVFESDILYSGCNYIVTEIDTILLSNGEERKRMQINAGLEGEENWEYFWIEGVGNISGPFYTEYCYFDIGEALLCFSEEDEWLYSYSGTNNCFQWTTSVKYGQLPTDVKIFPNPFSETLKIEKGDTDLESISIVDFTGRIVFQKDYTSASLAVSHVPNGVYLILVKDKAGNVYSDKLVKL